MTYNKIATITFEVVGATPRITHIPDWVRKIILWLARNLSESKYYGLIEFFITVTAIDMIAPEHGNHRLKEYFNTLNS